MAAPVTYSHDIALAPLSVAQYHAMRDAGILGEADDVELLDGLLVLKMTKLPPHSVACTLVKEALDRVIPDGFHLRVQDPITTADSEPEPDVAITRGRARDYLDRHPGPTQVPLVIEVADDSLPRDRGTKLRLYARAEITEYWIVNLKDRLVERHRDPAGDGYRIVDALGAGSRITLSLDGKPVGEIDIDALLP